MGLMRHATTLQRLTEPEPPVDTGTTADTISVYALAMENHDRARKGRGNFEAGI